MTPCAGQGTIPSSCTSGKCKEREEARRRISTRARSRAAAEMGGEVRSLENKWRWKFYGLIVEMMAWVNVNVHDVTNSLQVTGVINVLWKYLSLNW